MSYLRTSDLARAVGVHPNTVRRYVDRGLLPPVERSPSGYRRFTQRHLDCLRLACLVYRSQYPGRAIFQSGMRIVQAAVSGDLGGALELAHSHLALVQSERTQADIAADLLERWAFGSPEDTNIQPLQVGQAAHILGIVDVNTECSHKVTHGDISDRYPPNVPVHFRFCLLVREWLYEFFGCLSDELGQADQKPGRPNRKQRHHRKMHNWTQGVLADELYRLWTPGEIKQRDRGMMSTGMVSGWERGEHIPRPLWQTKRSHRARPSRISRGAVQCPVLGLPLFRGRQRTEK